MLHVPRHGGGRRPLVDPAPSGSLLRQSSGSTNLNIMSAWRRTFSAHALKKFVDRGMHDARAVARACGRYEYVLTKKGRDFFPTYLALKKWGDDWLAEPEGPQVVFRDRSSGRPDRVSRPDVERAANRCNSRTSRSSRAPAPCLSTESVLGRSHRTRRSGRRAAIELFGNPRPSGIGGSGAAAILLQASN